jgi:hypothetical protein
MPAAVLMVSRDKSFVKRDEQSVVVGTTAPVARAVTFRHDAGFWKDRPFGTLVTTMTITESLSKT